MHRHSLAGFACFLFFLATALSHQLSAAGLGKPAGTVRVATFNAAMNRKRAGALATELEAGNSPQAQKIAEIIQRVRPDVLLLNEVDRDANRRSTRALHDLYFKVPQNGQMAIEYAHQFESSVNTGVPFGSDLDQDGKSDGAADCFGYGDFPGQYGMIVMSKYPIETESVRTFQKFLWKDMPQARKPTHPDGSPFYSSQIWRHFRLSSKSHWDVPIRLSEGVMHLLACHPTPPVFDGPEDRNGNRNYDEIRFWADYVSSDKSRSEYIYDDSGVRGGLGGNAHFVVAGDLNADPNDGDSTGAPMKQLLQHKAINAVAPASEGGTEKSSIDGKLNLKHVGDPANDTGDFSDSRIGNLRIDYVLPSKTLNTVNSGVFWPKSDQDGNNLVSASDHRLVWIDIKIEKKP